MAQPRGERWEAALKEMIAKGRITVRDQPCHREESLLLCSEHHPVLHEALAKGSGPPFITPRPLPRKQRH